MDPEIYSATAAKYKEMREQIQASANPWFTVANPGYTIAPNTTTYTSHTHTSIFDQEVGGNEWAQSPEDQILFDLKAKVEEMEAMLGAAWMAITELQEIIDSQLGD